jgi:hypothetical protein
MNLMNREKRKMIKLSRLIKEGKDNRLDKYFKNFN